MLYVYDNIISLLKKTKENYNLSSKTIAQKIGATEAVVSRWLTGKAKPNSRSCEKIVQLLRETWVPGIVKLPPVEFWENDYYMRVEDIKNPFETWANGFFAQKDSQQFNAALSLWKEKNKYEVIRTYQSYSHFYEDSYRDENTYNNIEFLLIFSSPSDISYAFKTGELKKINFNMEIVKEALQE